jgi:hypothetical protein
MTAILVPLWLWRLIPNRWRVNTVGKFDYPINQHGSYDSQHNMSIFYYSNPENIHNKHVNLFCKFEK